MALFRRRDQSVQQAPTIPRFGAGRRLETDENIAQVLTTIERVLEVHAPTRYQHMPAVQPARVEWYGEGRQPDVSSTCSYGADDIFVFALWSGGPTLVGLFPLGGGEAELNTPFIGQWKQADPSLRSVGRFEPRQLGLLAPPVDDAYFREVLRLGGVEPTARNQATIARQVSELFALKAMEFMSSKDARAADRFVDAHRWDGDVNLPQRILDDLGWWNTQIIPYLHDLPWRVQGILLEPGPSGRPEAPIWQQMER
jgi:hypothetical protein